MTLVIYKNNTLAADSRSTIGRNQHESNTKCGHCGKDAHLVDDSKGKIVVASKNKAVNFREDRLIALAGSGNTSVIKKLQDVIMSGKDVEEVYQNFLLLSTRDLELAALMLICEKQNYILRVGSEPRKLTVKIHEKSETIMIGAGRYPARSLDHVSGNVLSPMELITLAMGTEDGVGGPVRYVDIIDNQAADIKIFDPEASNVSVDNIKAAFAGIKKMANPKPKAKAKTA